jgi:hypothetical protein
MDKLMDEVRRDNMKFDLPSGRDFLSNDPAQPRGNEDPRWGGSSVTNDRSNDRRGGRIDDPLVNSRGEFHETLDECKKLIIMKIVRN